MPRLEVSLIPSTSFFRNVRERVTPTQWNAFRRAVYAAAGYKCEICGGRGPDHPVECHEVFTYDGNIQTLVRLIALCPDCHMANHFGLAEIRGIAERILHHIARVNDWSLEEAEAHVIAAGDTWRERSKVRWVLDLSALTQYVAPDATLFPIAPHAVLK